MSLIATFSFFFLFPLFLFPLPPLSPTPPYSPLPTPYSLLPTLGLGQYLTFVPSGRKPKYPTVRLLSSQMQSYWHRR